VTQSKLSVILSLSKDQFGLLIPKLHLDFLHPLNFISRWLDYSSTTLVLQFDDFARGNLNQRLGKSFAEIPYCFGANGAIAFHSASFYVNQLVGKRLPFLSPMVAKSFRKS